MKATLVIDILIILIGLCGMLAIQNNVILFLISNELFLLGMGLMFVTVGNFYSDLFGQVCMVFILVISAVETAVIVVIMLYYYRLSGVWHISRLNSIYQPYK